MKALVKVPTITMARLSRYLFHLRCLEERGVTITASREIARGVGVNSVQVRKDLSYFGGFGRRGVGYEVSNLKQHITKILGFTKPCPIVIAGAGKLGRAICTCPDLKERGFQVVGIFDIDPQKLAKKVMGIEILPMNKLPGVVEQHEVEIGIVTVSAVGVQEVVELMKNSGIKKILTFGWCPFSVSDKIEIRNVDFVTELEMLAFKGKKVFCRL